MTNSRDKDLRHSRRLNFVPRWVVMPTIRKQNVAEHVFGVAQTVLWLLEFTYISGSAYKLQILTEALDHDSDEAISGDHPSPNKKASDPSKAPISKVVVKVADLFEAYAYLSEERAFGNRYGQKQIVESILQKLLVWWPYFPWSEDLGPKPTVYAVLKDYHKQVVPRVHPVMENLK